MRPVARAGLFLAAGAFLLVLGGAAGWMLNRIAGPEPAGPPGAARTPAEARILAVIREMRATGGVRFAIPESDGQRLRLLAETAGARHAVEIGTSTGYSTLWLCLGVLPAGGHVTTFEVDPRRAAAARENFKKAGVDQAVTVVLGDAHKTLAEVKGPVDLVFLDADKEGYVDYMDKVLPLLRPGGLILAHNVSSAPEFLRRVDADPSLETVRLTQASGLSATLKRRQAVAE
jgi:caffeoyl-CoA O-methyltransferase